MTHMARVSLQLSCVLRGPASGDGKVKDSTSGSSLKLESGCRSCVFVGFAME